MLMPCEIISDAAASVRRPRMPSGPQEPLQGVLVLARLDRLHSAEVPVRTVQPELRDVLAGNASVGLVLHSTDIRFPTLLGSLLCLAIQSCLRDHGLSLAEALGTFSRHL